MSAFKKRKDRRATPAEVGTGSPDPRFRFEVNQTFIEHLYCIVKSSGGRVNLR
jgi:hypothetical protein